MGKINLYSLTFSFILICWITTIDSAPQSISTNDASPSTIVSPITKNTSNPKKKSSNINVKSNNNTTSSTKVPKVSDMAKALEKVEITPEFLENTMNEYVELSKAYYEDAPNDAVREKRTLRVFTRLREGVQSGVSLIRSLFPSVGSLPFLGGGSSSGSSSSSDDDSGSGSSSSGSSGGGGLGGRFLSFASNLLRTMFNFLSGIFRTVRGLLSGGGGGGGGGGPFAAIKGLFRRPTTTTEAPDYSSDDEPSSDSDSGSSSSGSSGSSDDSGSSSSSQVSADSGSSWDVKVEDGGYAPADNSDIDIRDNPVSIQVLPPKDLPMAEVSIDTRLPPEISDFKPLPSFPDDNIKPLDSGYSSSGGSSSSSSSAGSSGYSDSSMSSSSSSKAQSGYSGSSNTYIPPKQSSSSSSGGYSYNPSSSSSTSSGGGYSSYNDVSPQRYSIEPAPAPVSYLGGLHEYPYNQYIVTSPSLHHLFDGPRLVVV